MLTLGEMTSRVSNRIQKSDSAFQSHIKEWIDERYGDIWDRFLWPQSVRSKESGVTFIASEAFLILPKDVDEVIVMSERDADRVLTTMNQNQLWRSFVSSIDNSGNPINAAPAGTVQYKDQNASAETLDVVSTSTSDTTQTVRVWMLVNGEEVSETVSLNGTSAATTTNTCDANGFLRASKDGNTVGVVTVSGNTSSTELIAIAPEEFTAYYKRYRFRHVPDAADTLSLVYKKKRVRLVNDEDVPEFDCSEALIQGAYSDALREQKQFQRADVVEMRKYEPRIERMIDKLMQGEQIDQAMPHIEPRQRGLNVGQDFFRIQNSDG